MYRIRFHGRGGQGMKTASRILGRAFFLAGYEVQDAPRYGAERRGAPIFAYVRAARSPINERGIIQHPDLVVVADDSLISLPSAGVLTGLTDRTIFLIYSDTDEKSWQHRLNLENRVFTIPVDTQAADPLQRRYAGVSCVGGAARLTGVIDLPTLETAIEEEMADRSSLTISTNIDHAGTTFSLLAQHDTFIEEGTPFSAVNYQPPQWLDLVAEPSAISAPAIYGGGTSNKVKTGLWRTMRPVIQYDKCRQCWWICSTFCPDSAISVTENRYTKIDYDHCKGCMVCVMQCPSHAILAIAEKDADRVALQEVPS